MFLSQAKEGQRLKISKIAAGKGLKGRLAAIGLFPGATVRVVKSAPGPVIVESSGSKVALGQGMARKVEVEEIEEDSGSSRRESKCGKDCSS